jgi:hypothetical protein
MGLSTNGRDAVARLVGGDTLSAVGTATGSSATSLTDSGASFTASSGGPPALGGLVGHIVVAGSTAANLTYGVIISNTTTALTIDQWHTVTTPETAASTPSATAPYVVLPGGAPCFYMGISVATRVFTAADTVLTNDGSTVSELWFSGGGLRRRLASWSHTNGTATYALANTFTANGSDTLPQTIAKVGIFQHYVNTTVTTSNSGILLFQTLLSATATLSASGDNVAITDTVTIS